MPPDRMRTVNSQGRQKACSECAKGKRKCSLGQPSCARCRKQRLACTYPPQPSGQLPTSEESMIDTPEDFDVADMSLGLENGDDTFALDFDFPPLPYPRNTDFTDFDSSAGITSLDASSNMMCDSTDGEYRMVVGGSLNYMGQPCSTAQIAPSARTRINWSIEQLKLAPRSMVEQNGTPWQHSMLYENHMPRHLQDAYAACALYNARNGTNDEFVARFIRERVRDILADPIPQQPNELLARAHAVMLYQIMLVFGGDVRLYSQAELLLPLMEEIGTALLPLSAQQIDPTGSLPFYPSTAASSAWAAYMFRESFRRTILSLYLFITLCYLLRGETAPCSTHLAFGNRFTLSAHLWNAKSAFEYAIAWNDEKHFLIEGLDFTEVMTSASPEDVDAFGKMIMIGLQGEDDIRGWLHTKGSTL